GSGGEPEGTAARPAPSASRRPRSTSRPVPPRPPRPGRRAERRPAGARVARSRQGAVAPDLNRGRPAEVEVPAAPADDVVAPALELVELSRIGPALTVNVAVVEVDSWRRACIFNRN